MAELSVADRQRIWRGLQRHWSNIREGVTGPDTKILISINETDAWIEDSQASYNSALTYAADFTAAQKTLIFCAVALARVSITFLRRMFGEVD